MDNAYSKIIYVLIKKYFQCGWEQNRNVLASVSKCIVSTNLDFLRQKFFH